ncbi:YihY/virulence factor BrkB family protein [Tsuneonella amylolytica]|uniref:YihY/virulence factor BrkB family protein n=1 Tax=Tsuneonella amylolytica TaxID=2338327 RepID=UPI001F33AC7B|nr:YihY/virulence factor BrkB family protein [Tsuneonella amylolytica]
MNSNDDDRTRAASAPTRFSWRDYKAVLLRTWKEASADNVGLMAAGVAFYCFLALVPLLAATILTYGLVVDIETVREHLTRLLMVLPSDVGPLVTDQIANVVRTSEGKKGLGLLIALAIALFGARNAAGSIVSALNIAYEEEERRSFVKVNILALAITMGAVVTAILAAIGVGAMRFMPDALPAAGGLVLVLGRLVTYALLGLAAATGAALLYRYGPARDHPKWRWLTPGSIFFALGWIALTIGFGIYVSRFGSYGATYGSLSAVVVLLTWIYLSAYVLLFGAELNSELEHQTSRDTTTGPEEPMGERGAWAADHVASDEASAPA